jgi:AcrR family transcriptional regulator
MKPATVSQLDSLNREVVHFGCNALASDKIMCRRTASHSAAYGMVNAMAESAPAGPTRRRTPVPRDQKKAQTRRRLLDAATNVFARRGFHGASVEDVVEEAGLTTGALYWHFKNKEELFLVLSREQVDKRLAEIRRVPDMAATPEALEQAAGRQFGSFIEHDPHWPLLFYEFWAYAVRDPHLRKEFGDQRRAVRSAIAEAIRRQASQAGVRLPLDSDALALGLGALMNGLAFERVADPQSVPDSLYGFLMSRFMSGVMSGPAPNGN